MGIFAGISWNKQSPEQEQEEGRRIIAIGCSAPPPVNYHSCSSKGEEPTKDENPSTPSLTESDVFDDEEGALGKDSMDTSGMRHQPYRNMVLLLLVCLLPFGGHFVMNCLSSLEYFMLKDPHLGLTEAKYGLLVSMSSIPNFFIPFLGGVFLDKSDGRFATLFFLFMVLVGQVTFTIAMSMASFNYALVGRFIVGLGEGSVMVAQRAALSQYFHCNMSFAMGVSVAMAVVSKTMARATVVPIAEATGSYIGALWYTCLTCLFSTLVGVVLVILSDDPAEALAKQQLHRTLTHLRWTAQRTLAGEGDGNKGSANNKESLRRYYSVPSRLAPPSLTRIEVMEQGHPSLQVPTYASMVGTAVSFTTLGATYWLLCILHALYVVAFHSFIQYEAHFIMVKFHKDPKTAAYITSLANSLVIVAGPLAGYLMDVNGGQLVICFLCSILANIAYFLLTFMTFLTPYPALGLLSIAESFIPMITMALIPATVPSTLYGTAYGILEVVTAVSNVSSNIVMGLLIDRDPTYMGATGFLLGLTLVGTILFIAVGCIDYFNKRRNVIPPLDDLNNNYEAAAVSIK